MPVQRSTLKRLKRLPRMFRKTDAEKIAPHTAMFLTRATAGGFIHRINRGNYINSFLYGFPRIEDVACFLRPPAYISCEWALNYRGITLQSPVVCSVITLSSAVGRRRTVGYRNVRIEFSRIASTLFFGFEVIDEFCMATPEKAILDTLHLRKGLPASDELEWDAIDRDRLLAAAQQYPSSVLFRLNRLLGNY